MLNGTRNTTKPIKTHPKTMSIKSLMQNLSQAFEQVESSADSNELPPPGLVSDLLHYSRQIQMDAPEEWAVEAEDFAHLVDQLNKAVKNGDLHSAIRIIHSLKDAQSFCHDTLL